MQVFASLMLAAGGVWLFLFSQKQGDSEHIERLTLLPIEDDDAASSIEDSALPFSSRRTLIVAPCTGGAGARSDSSVSFVGHADPLQIALDQISFRNAGGDIDCCRIDDPQQGVSGFGVCARYCARSNHCSRDGSTNRE